MADPSLTTPQNAAASFQGRRLHAAAALRVTPAGLLAIPPIIRAAKPR